MASGDTTTVRVRQPDADRLRAVAERQQTTVIEVVHSALDALERQEFLRGMSEDYRRLQGEPERWAAYLSEREDWDAIG